MENKKCKICKTIKPTSEFYKTKGYFYNECKECGKIRVRNWFRERYQNDPAFRNHHNAYKKTLNEKLKNNNGMSVSVMCRNGGRENVLAVYERDNNSCQRCGATENLCIHHRDGQGYWQRLKGKKMNNDLDNLVVLCDPCHSVVHSRKLKV
jgi:hypothetical protein